MIFSLGQIALTAGITALLGFAAAIWRLPRGAWPDIVAVAGVSGVAVLLWRLSANMPQLNAPTQRRTACLGSPRTTGRPGC